MTTVTDMTLTIARACGWNEKYVELSDFTPSTRISDCFKVIDKLYVSIVSMNTLALGDEWHVGVEIAPTYRGIGMDINKTTALFIALYNLVVNINNEVRIND